MFHVSVDTSHRWQKPLPLSSKTKLNQSLTPRSALRAMKQPSMSAVLRKDQTILKHLVVWDSLSDHVAAFFPSGNSLFRWYLESTLLLFSSSSPDCLSSFLALLPLLPFKTPVPRVPGFFSPHFAFSMEEHAYPRGFSQHSW